MKFHLEIASCDVMDSYCSALYDVEFLSLFCQLRMNSCVYNQIISSVVPGKSVWGGGQFNGKCHLLI